MQFKSADGVWANAKLSILSSDAHTRNAQLDDRNTNILLLYRPAAARPELLYIYIHFPPHNDENTTVSQFRQNIFQNPSRITLSLINIDYVMSRHFHSSLPLPLFTKYIYARECVRIPFLTLIC